MGPASQVPLAPYTTLGLGGPAARFIAAGTESALVDAVRGADQRGEPLLVLGGGSNVVVADTFNNRVAVFTSGNPLAPVPALGIWGLLLSALLLAGIGYHATRRSAA